MRIAYKMRHPPVRRLVMTGGSSSGESAMTQRNDVKYSHNHSSLAFGRAAALLLDKIAHVLET